MRGLFSLSLLAVAAAGLMFAMPSASHAQDCGYGGYGRPSYGGNYDRGYSPGYSGNYDRGYSPGYSGYSGTAYGPSYGGYYDRRPVIQHPTSGHWSPDRGPHTHGHTHVPHRGHYHTRPY